MSREVLATDPLSSECANLRTVCWKLVKVGQHMDSWYIQILRLKGQSIGRLPCEFLLRSGEEDFCNSEPNPLSSGHTALGSTQGGLVPSIMPLGVLRTQSLLTMPVGSTRDPDSTYRVFGVDLGLSDPEILPS